MSIAEQITQLKTDFDEVYEAGYEKGKAEGGDTTAAYNQGVADGKQAEYDAFWNEAQQNGNRTNYRVAFSGGMWTSENLKPKYYYAFPEGTTTLGAEVFSRCGIGNKEADGMVDVSFACAKFDFSKCKTPNNLFLNACVKNITIDLSGATQLNSIFSQADGGLHDNIKLKVSANCVFNLTFAYCDQLKTLEFLEGSEIGQNGLDLHWSPLTHESLVNVVNTLSTATTGLTVTLPLVAINNAFEGGREGAEWQALIATKPNWTIAYA